MVDTKIKPSTIRHYLPININCSTIAFKSFEYICFLVNNLYLKLSYLSMSSVNKFCNVN